MNQLFQVIKPEELNENVFKLIGKDWMLITAGNKEKFNTMTASWGGLGILWNKKVCFCFIRPNRYTYEFMENENTFTLSFLEEKYREVLRFCGSNSGRDVDKIATTGITPIESIHGSVYFEEAKLVMECRKIYTQDLSPESFVEPELEKNYNGQDYHRLYIGEIIDCYLKENE
ncbi:flavin reductase family protein [Dehalobacter sp. DCM]|uniref:flavin reductase family protein n=1 Tax=Dehalobacter sp. DCM TaxID=2907827 RepID=UPI003081A241|nr:flavin reductase family protein [Dehalobacter sp. DCM]